MYSDESDNDLEKATKKPINQEKPFDKNLTKALDDPVVRKNGNNYNYSPMILSKEVLLHKCKEHGIQVLTASSKPIKTLDLGEDTKFSLDANKELQTFILSFDNYSHSEGFAVFKRNEEFFLMPFSTDEYTNYIDKQYLHNLVAEKLNILPQKLFFIDKEHLSGLQSDSHSCHTMALVNCIKTIKNPEIISKYIDNICKTSICSEENGIPILKSDNYYPVYASLTQSLSKLSQSQQDEYIDKKYLSELFITKDKTKPINSKLQLKTIQYSSPEGKVNVRRFKDGVIIGDLSHARGNTKAYKL